MIPLILIASLLLTGSAWAETKDCNTCSLIAPGATMCTSLHCVSAEEQQAWDEQQSKQKTNEQQLDHALRAERDCTDKMEAAMKAMEGLRTKARRPERSDGHR